MGWRWPTGKHAMSRPWPNPTLRKVVGLSKVRATSSLAGVPIAVQPERLRCGFAVVDLHTGQVIAHFEFVSGLDELFDIQLLPGISSPFLSGPLADRGPGQPIWTVPP